MGCAGGKEFAAEAEHRQKAAENAAGRKQRDRRRAQRAAAAGPAVLPAQAQAAAVEMYWAAGTVSSGGGAPHFVPLLGPASVFEKLPAPPDAVVGRILFAVQDDDALSVAAHRAAAAAADGDAASTADGATVRSSRPTAVTPLTAGSLAMPGDASGAQLASMVMPLPRFLLSAAHVAQLTESNSAGAAAATGTAAPLADWRFRVPGDSFVGRCYLPHSLHNYSVGWVKVPSAPVVRRRTVSASAVAPQSIVAHSSAATSVAPESSLVAERGFMNATKPFYDVHFDGPASAPLGLDNDDASDSDRSSASDGALSDGGDGEPADNAQREQRRRARQHRLLAAPRHLEQYYLYVQRVASVGLAVAWRSVSPTGAASDVFADLPGAFAVTLPSGVDQTPAVPGCFFSMPVLSPESADRCQSLHATALVVEKSLPLFIRGNLEAQYSAWWSQLAVLSGCGGGISSGDERARALAVVQRGASQLSDEERCWLAFRLQFSDWLLNQCRGAAGTVGVALSFGLRFLYDNQHFVAYNSFGHFNDVEAPLTESRSPSASAATLPGHHELFLQFSDTTRSSYATSATIASSSVVLSCCRAEAVASVDPEVGMLAPQRSAQEVLEEEFLQLKFLFANVMPAVQINIVSLP